MKSRKKLEIKYNREIMEVFMKKEKNLTKILYVFVVLSLVYTGYTLFSTYSALSTYIAAGTITTAQIIETLISYCFNPVMLTVILYALACMNETLIKLLVRDEEVKEEKKEAPEQKVEKDETDTIESKEIVDKTNEDQAEK